MTFQYRINKTYSTETNGPLLMKIAYVNSNVARLYFTDTKDQPVSGEKYEYLIKDLTSNEVLFPFNDSYFIVWTSAYEVLYKGKLTVNIQNSKQQLITRVLPPEQQNPNNGGPFPFPL